MLTRTEKAAFIRAARADGLTTAQIAEQLGMTVGGVRNLITDPDGAKQRARRERYRGRCEVCGAPTDGSCGFDAPKLCGPHNRERQHEERHWTRERIVEAFREFARVNGRAPTSTDVLATTPSMARGMSDARLKEAVAMRTLSPLPPWNIVYREFGSWPAALDAAGLPRNATGYTMHRRAAL